MSSPTDKLFSLNDDYNTINNLPESINNSSESINNSPESINNLPESVNNSSESINNLPESINNSSEFINSEFKDLIFNSDNYILIDTESDSCVSSFEVKPKKYSIIDYEKNRNLKCNRSLENNVYLRPIIIYDKFINLYSKGLLHDKNGYVNVNEMYNFLMRLERRDIDSLSEYKFDKISLSLSDDIIGNYNNTYRYSSLPSLNDHQLIMDMIQLYCMSLCRDIPFKDYISDSLIKKCVFSKSTNVGNIFRGPIGSCIQGCYISQFLYVDINTGFFVQKQLYDTFVRDYMKTSEESIAVQNGNFSNESIQSKKRYIITGRDIAHYVHSEDHYQTGYNTSLILFDLKVPLNYPFDKNTIHSFIFQIINKALMVSSYHKWNSLFLRPEAYSIQINNSICKEILMNPVMKKLKSINGNYLLTQVYPEASPLSPSTPSNAATVIGASVTVLKFFFDNNYELNVYEPDNDGQNLIDTKKKTCVGDELNKLAFNISFGRNWAGVNYIMDSIRGLKLGETIAISCLKDIIKYYPFKIKVMFQKFNNKSCIITN